MKVELRIHTVLILHSILKAPGAAKDIAEVYRAGKLIVETLKVPMGLTEEGQEEKVEVEIAPEDRALIKSALEIALERRSIGVTEWLMELVTKLEFIPKT